MPLKEESSDRSSGWGAHLETLDEGVVTVGVGFEPAGLSDGVAKGVLGDETATATTASAVRAAVSTLIWCRRELSVGGTAGTNAYGAAGTAAPALCGVDSRKQAAGSGV